ncbi:MAG: hypothetical protein ABJC87_21670 [Roseobacter sp.]
MSGTFLRISHLRAHCKKGARAQGAGVYALSSGAAQDFDETAPDQPLVLGYPSLNEKQFDLAVKFRSDIVQ